MLFSRLSLPSRDWKGRRLKLKAEFLSFVFIFTFFGTSAETRRRTFSVIRRIRAGGRRA